MTFQEFPCQTGEHSRDKVIYIRGYRGLNLKKYNVAKSKQIHSDFPITGREQAFWLGPLLVRVQ